MNKLNKIAAGIALTTSLFAGQAMAAVQGTIGDTSTGKSDVTLTIVDKVQISGVDDIALGTFDGSTDLAGGSAFCVYRNGAAGYTMTLSAEGKTNFEVASVISGDTIGFTAKVDNDNDASNGSSIAHGATSATYSGSSATDCGGADNASIAVNFAAADLQSAGTAADYTATVVILVEPI